jgi:FAD/FMN-containing dehydrogenase
MTVGHYPADFETALREILGADGVLGSGEIALLDPGVTSANLAAGLLARPASATEVAATLLLAARFGVAVVPQGGRTGLAGGATTSLGDLILSADRLCRIELVDADARVAVVEAGVRLEQLDEALAAHGLSAGIDLGARGSATIGGMVACNAGGIDAFRYGTMRERVLGLEAVLPSGEILDMLTRVRKDNSGLPLRQLFVGSEGTLGFITRVALQLVPASPARYAALTVTDAATKSIRVMRAIEDQQGLCLVAAEVMSGNHVILTAASLGIRLPVAVNPDDLVTIFSVSADAAGPDLLADALMEATEAGIVKDCVLPKNAAEERDLWRIREDWAVDRQRPGGLWFDISVPISRLGDYLSAVRRRVRALDSSLEVFIVGHLADGNLHVTVNADVAVTDRYEEVATLVYEGLKEHGGSFSAEHGIGLEKRRSLEKWVGETQIDLMRRLKAVFDPTGVMNPGKVLFARRS